MSTNMQDRQLTLGMVEAMFDYLDKLEGELGDITRGGTNKMRSNLGLPRYRFVGEPKSSFFPACGAPVKFVFPSEGRQEATKPASPTAHRPAAAVNDPETCRRKGLCAPHRVRQQFTLCDQDVVVVRNLLPYGRNHGVVRSADHEPQAHCFEPRRLELALSVACALGTETGFSGYEVWVAGDGFNTQWHFHIQFRKQRSPIWEYVDKLQPSATNEQSLQDYPSRPIYFQNHDRSQLCEAIARRIPEKSWSDGGPAVGLLISYEQARWKAILVKSWYPPGELLFGKQPGLHEHLGEVILESHEEFLRVKQNPSAATQSLEAQLSNWCLPKAPREAG